jgi:N-methylhydantoinase A
VRERAFFDAGLRREVTAREVRRADLAPGMVVEGPAVIVEDETSTIVTSAFRAVGQEDGAILIARKEGRA